MKILHHDSRLTTHNSHSSAVAYNPMKLISKVSKGRKKSLALFDTPYD